MNASPFFYAKIPTKKVMQNKMKDMFTEIHKNEKNENTAFILMLGVLSEKLTEIINLLSANNEKFSLIKKDLDSLKQEKAELKDNKVYMPITSADYD